MLVEIGGPAESLSDPDYIERIGALRGKSSYFEPLIQQCQRALELQLAETDADRAKLLFWLAEALLAAAEVKANFFQCGGATIDRDKVVPPDVHVYAQRALELAYKADRPDYELIVSAECLRIRALAHVISHNEFMDALSQLRQRTNDFRRPTSDQRRVCERMLTYLESLSSKYAADGRFIRV